jgi:hypothetical protein
VFTALCAERLLPLYGRFHEESGSGNPSQLAAALEVVWLAIDGSASTSDLVACQKAAEALVPDEDDESWMDASAYGQNGAAAVAYAARVAQTDDPKDALRAARQVYEAADYAAQQQLPELDLNTPGADARLQSTPVVQQALASLGEDLGRVRSLGGAVKEFAPQLREEGRRGGRLLAELV